MNIFVISEDNLGVEGGGITHIFETFEPMLKRGHGITLFAPGKGKPRRPSGITIRYVFSPFSGALGALFFNLSLFLSLFRHLIVRRPDVIYTRQLGYSCVPLLMARLFRVPHCLEVNGVLHDELRIIKASPVRLGLVHYFSLLNYRFSDGISVTVRETADRIRELYNVAPEIISIVPCDAANHHLFKPAEKYGIRKKLSIGAEEFILGFVGSLYEWHGIDLLIRSFPKTLAAIPDARLLIIGDGIESSNLKALAEELKVSDRITFTGSIPYGQVPRYIPAFDAGISFFKPVRPVPGIPMKMYEYMACEVPVIASALPGYGEVAASEHAGISVDAGDPGNIAGAAVTLYKDPELRMAMGRNGRKAVERQFNWERVSMDVERFITKTMAPG